MSDNNKNIGDLLSTPLGGGGINSPLGGAGGTIYFIGIGGIGMSALARYFHSKNYTVSGYDRTSTELTRTLEASGIAIHYEENLDLIPKDAKVIVYTPAIPAQHAELVYYQQNGYKFVKRSDILQWITESSFNICVAGTHGKTTTTTITGYILRHSGYGCNAFLGGIAANYNTNFWSDTNNVVVVEADEYDRSFLKLTPDVAIITAMDADHLDIYGTPEEFGNAFIQFSQKIKKGGCLISKYCLARDAEFTVSNHLTYSLNDIMASIYAKDIKVVDGSYLFDVVYKDETISDITLNMGGLHNIENAVAAIGIAKYLNISDEKIKEAIADFRGVKRRFEYIVKTEKQVLIDDYAHHPEELRALISGIRSLYGKEKLTLIFQPHLYSRTNDLANEFGVSLSMADEVILLPIYPARELPIPGVNSELLLDKMTIANKQVLGKKEMVEWVKRNKPGLIVMAGAGDIDVLVGVVRKVISEQ
jgi:UDP-N-acetylmuramate--alanine ligase